MYGEISHIIVIQSLLDEDEPTGKILYNDIIARGIEQHKQGITHVYYEVSNKQDLEDVLSSIVNIARNTPHGILIHFEMHGKHTFLDEENLIPYYKREGNDGLQTSDGSIVTWIELVELFREINIASNNNLYISLASCHGRYLFEGVEPDKKSPYKAYVSASREVINDEILQSFHCIFENLVKNKNFTASYEICQSSAFYYKDSEETFKINILDIKNRLDTDEAFRDSLISSEARALGIDDPDILIQIIQEVYNTIYFKYKAAFDFEQ